MTAPLPAKFRTEETRAASRQLAHETAMEHHHRGDHWNARNYFAKSIDVSPTMAAELIACLKATRPSVKCLVAPYEADAQLAYMCKQDIVDGVITEDSDAIPYGCKEVLDLR